MLVDDIKTRVESAYGVCNQRLKLKYRTVLSSFAFKFNLRRYAVLALVDADPYGLKIISVYMQGSKSMAGRCRLTRNRPMLNAPGRSRLKLRYDEVLSNFAFKFNLRRYSMAFDSANLTTPDIKWLGVRRGLTLVQFSAQRKHSLWATRVHFSA